jgi:hypothetical protein
MEWMNIPFWISECVNDLVSLSMNIYSLLCKAFVASKCYLLGVMLLILIAARHAICISHSDSQLRSQKSNSRFPRMG